MGNNDLDQREPTPDCDTTDVSNPLRGVVLCCTAIPPEKRVELASQVEQMGAQHKYDLTSEVTHLIVGDNTTEKYKYVARERPDIRVIMLEWVNAVLGLWIRGLPINMDMLEKQYTYPTFSGLKICMTGFEDPTERQRIIDDVMENGAEYHGDLTKKVTHLISWKPEGPKYKHAKNWGLKVVAIEWLRDSLERGMILNEDLYDPEETKEKRGKGAWVRQNATKLPLGKRSRNNSAVGLEDGKRKLRRTASTKLTSQNENIWGDIVGDSAKVQTAQSGQWEELNGQLLEPGAITTAPQIQAPIDLSNSMVSIKCGTFVRCKFYIHGFDRRKAGVVQQFILSHDAEMSNTIEELASSPLDRKFLVVPHNAPASEVPDVPQSDRPIKVITEWWIERCLEARTFIDPQDYIIGHPFPILPIPSFERFKICSTGFGGIQLLHICKAAALMGAKYEEFFSNEISVLICNPNRMMRKEKLALAQEWKIPIVTLAWLLDSIKAGKKQLFKPYIQQAKKNAGPTSKLIADVALADGQNDHTEKTNEFAKIELQGSNGHPRAAITSELDKTAFQNDDAPNDDTPTIKVEESSSTMDSTPVVQPLKEISPNSPRKPLSPPKEAVEVEPAVTHPSGAQETISDAISSLLAKSKTVVAYAQDRPRQADGHEGVRKKRAPTKIFGRAASNISAVSVFSRASSVDSAGSTGQSTAWSTLKSPSGEQRRNSSSVPGSKAQPDSNILKLMGGLTEGTADVEPDNGSQPTMTQMQYDDPESVEYKERVIARVTGSKIEKKKGKERTPTIASLANLMKVGSQAPPGKRTRTLRERMNGKARV